MLGVSICQLYMTWDGGFDKASAIIMCAIVAAVRDDTQGLENRYTITLLNEYIHLQYLVLYGLKTDCIILFPNSMQVKEWWRI